MYKISSLPQSVNIGFVGENKFRKLEVDMTDWIDDMPDGVPSIIYQAPGGTAATVATTFTDGILSWEILEDDLGVQEGKGRIQFDMRDGSVVRKSNIIDVEIHLSIGG